MAGRGKNATLGGATESTYKTGVVPGTFFPFNEGNITNARELIESGTLSGSRVLLNTTNAAEAPGFTFTIEHDGSGWGLPFFWWNGGSDGHSVADLPGKITAAPTESVVSGNTGNVDGFAKTVDSEATFTDYTSEVTGAGFADLSSLDTAANGDHFYAGASQPFDQIDITMTANVNGTTATLTAEYWDGCEWQAITGLTDGTDSGGATLAQTGSISFTRPTGWKNKVLASNVASGRALYWVRFSVSAALDASVEVDDADADYGSFTAGTYTYQVAPVVKWDKFDTAGSTQRLFIYPSSATSDPSVVSATDHVDLTWTDPTGLTLPDGFSYYGTVVYRSATGPAGDHAFVAFLLGTGTTYTDFGQVRDTAVISHSADIKEHTFTLPATEAELPGFSLTIDSDIDKAKRLEGSRMNGFTKTIGGVNEIVTFAFDGLGIRVNKDVPNPAGGPTINEPIAGTRVIVSIDDTARCELESITISGTNGLVHVFGLCGVEEPQDVQDDDFRRVSGSFTRQLLDQDLLCKVLEGEEFSIQVNSFGQPQAASSKTNLGDHGLVSDAFSFASILDLPRNRAGDADAPIPSGGARIIETVSFTTFKDNSEATDLKLRLYNTTAAYA